MPETKQHQDNQHHRDRSQPAGDQEHETHVMALVLLSLATIVIITIILSVNQQVADLNPDNYDDEVTQPVDDDVHGAGIPVRQVETQDQEGMVGFPSSLALPEGASVVRNTSRELSENRTQRVVVLETQDSITDIITDYSSWAENNQLTIQQTTNQGETGSIIASHSAGQLTIAASSAEGNNRVQFNYVTTN